MVDEVEIDEAGNEEVEEEKKALSTKKIIILAVLAATLLSGGLVSLTIYLMADDGSANVATADAVAKLDAAEDEDVAEVEDEASAGPVRYHRMDPKFVVSFHDQTIARFMQFSVQIMTHDKEVIEQIKIHDPAIRSNLLLLFDGQEANVINTREGKEKLLELITEDINNSLEALAGISGVEAAYFDSFVMQ